MSSADVVLSTKGLTKSFSDFVAVNQVDLQVRRGDIHALIGPNGAGKSTLFNLITKFLRPTKGTITYEGQDITRLAPAKIARLGIVRSFQISAVFPTLSAVENVQIALQQAQRQTFQFWRSPKVLAPLHERARQLLADVGLANIAGTPASTLSYGHKRAIEIATTLALDPQMLLLDEPFAGLAADDVQRIAALIRKVAVGRTVLMVEHNMQVIADLSDVITVLQRGEILAEGPYDLVSQDPRVLEAYLGAPDE